MDPAQDWLALYRAHVRPLYAFASRRCGGDRELAEDVTQEAFLRALATWREPWPQEPLAWLQTVSRNLLLNHFRRRTPQRLDPEAVEAALSTPAERAWESPDAAALLQHGLAQLATRHAEVLEAFYLDGQDTHTIAERRGLSLRAVEGRLRRARGRLRTILLALPDRPDAWEPNHELEARPQP